MLGEDIAIANPNVLRSRGWLWLRTICWQPGFRRSSF